MIAPNLPWLEAFSEITGICLFGALFSKRKPKTLQERKKYLEKKFQEFKRVHVFDKDWNILPDEYDAVW